MKVKRSLRSSTTMMILGALSAASATAACSANEPAPQKRSGAWDCSYVEVPMGNTLRCTSTASASDVQTPSASDQTGATGGDGEIRVRSYGTPGSDTPPETAPGSGSSDGTTDSPPDAPSTPYECSPGSSSPDCPSSSDVGTPSGETPKPPSSPSECGDVPDLPYCGGGASGGSPPSTPPASPPPMKCSKDAKGNKVCESAPTCSPGSHPSDCGACVLDSEPGECIPPSEGGCWVTGGGFIVEPSIVPGAPADGNDNYGGNAKQMKDGSIQGHWNHVDHGTQHHAKGRPEYIYCRHVDEPGPGGPGANKGFTMNQIYFGGHAEWNANGGWESGYWFDVVAKDHGEPGSQPSPKNGGMVDTYHFTIRKMDDPAAKVSGPIVYEVKGGLVGGNIQMHPPNNGHPGFQSPLPSWVGLEP